MTLLQWHFGTRRSRIRRFQSWWSGSKESVGDAGENGFAIPVKITLHGAAGEVTGSAYLLETERARVLVDFGLFQGGPGHDAKNVLSAGLLASRLDAVLLTHAHLDHVGRLPLLFKGGYEGPIHATGATRDLA